MGIRQEATPPRFLRLAGHPLRWRLLAELARSDLQVHELEQLMGEPQNLISYHLSRLRAAGLVTARRSSADGRGAYYSVDLTRCGALLSEAGTALHPGLGSMPPTEDQAAPVRAAPQRAALVQEAPVQEAPVRAALVQEAPVRAAPVRAGVRPPARANPARARASVLFLCTGNSARSQMAQAILEQMAGPAVAVASAGSNPKPLHPNAIRVMRDRGIDISDRQSKHVSVFAGRRFGYVITLCDRVREVCPDFGGQAEVAHWSVADPAAAGDAADTYPAFAAVADDLGIRIGFLLSRIRSCSAS